MRIVLVHSGEKLPRHLIANLDMLSRTFPDKELLTVVDNTSTQLELTSKGYVSYRSTSNLNNYKFLIHKLSHDYNFWDGFWYRTIKRFFLLHEFMQVHPDSPIMHIESDVILLPNFPFDEFMKLKEDLAFPLISQTHAVASVMYIRNFEAIDSVISFFGEVELEVNDTDMTLLSKFVKAKKNVFVLPTSLSSLKSSKEKLLHSNSLYFDGVFDGATYGQFLFGLDPRNFFGIRKLYYSPTTHVVDGSLFKYSIGSSQGKTIITICDQSNSSAPLYNLHVHSKDIRVFKQDLTNPLLTLKRCKESSNGVVRYEFDFRAFVSYFPRHVVSVVFYISNKARNFIYRNVIRAS